MNNILQNLEEYIIKHPDRSFFASGVLLETIQEVEIRLRINLPDSYKLFLQKYNGGYIASQVSDKQFLPEWESNYILSLEEMAIAYQEKEDVNWKLDSDYHGLYPFIPICKLPNNEILITINRDEVETPIFDAWHEAFSSEWGMLHESFKDFLKDYINKEGRIKTIAEDNDIHAKKFIPDYTSNHYYKV